MQFFFFFWLSFHFSLFPFSPSGTPRSPLQSPDKPRSDGGHAEQKPLCKTPGTLPHIPWGEWARPVLVRGAVASGAPHGANKSADAAAIAAILHFQNFLPPLPKYKGTFVLNTALERWWAPWREPCGIWFLATVHVFIMMGEGKEGSCSYQHANNLLQRTGALRAN